MISPVRFPAILILLSCAAFAQPAGYNYDESKVGPYTLPDPLVAQNGARVRDAATWEKVRRPEILELFTTQVYGRTPKGQVRPRFELTSTDKNALGGTATRKQITAYFTSKPDGPKMDILLYVPSNARKPVPIFVGLNFTGNHTVNADPGIKLADVWVKGKKVKAEEKSRGVAASRYQIEKILARGYAVAAIYYGDIEPDFDGGLPHGVRPLFYRAGQTEPAADEWGAIGAWAWGLSRAVDYFETDKDINAKQVALIGHSRLGKAALWAGAQDKRFAIVISNDSGEGGAALSRRIYGETVERLNTSFPHWFCKNYRKYNGRADQMPVNQHMLLSLIAPRPLYVASAEEDTWADPRGEFLSAVAAGPVYALLGKQGLGTDKMPGIERPIMQTVGYHIRSGKHDVTAYDWDQYLTFADKHFKSK